MAAIKFLEVTNEGSTFFMIVGSSNSKDAIKRVEDSPIATELLIRSHFAVVIVNDQDAAAVRTELKRE